MNTMCEKVKKIMAIVIDCCITKEDAMEVLRVKYDWLYPYITEAVWNEHYSLYMNSKGLLVEEPEVEGSTSSEDVECDEFHEFEDCKFCETNRFDNCLKCKKRVFDHTIGKHVETEAEDGVVCDSCVSVEQFCCSCGKGDVWYTLGDKNTPMCECHPDYESDDEDDILCCERCGYEDHKNEDGEWTEVLTHSESDKVFCKDCMPEDESEDESEDE